MDLIDPRRRRRRWRWRWRWRRRGRRRRRRRRRWRRCRWRRRGRRRRRRRRWRRWWRWRRRWHRRRHGARRWRRRRRHRTVLLHLSRRRIVRIRHRSWVTAFALVLIVALRDTSRNRHGDEGQYYQWDAHTGLLTKVCGSLKSMANRGKKRTHDGAQRISSWWNVRYDEKTVQKSPVLPYDYLTLRYAVF